MLCAYTIILEELFFLKKLFLVGHYLSKLYKKKSLNVLKLSYFLIFQGKPFEYLCSLKKYLRPVNLPICWNSLFKTFFW